MFDQCYRPWVKIAPSCSYYTVCSCLFYFGVALKSWPAILLVLFLTKRFARRRPPVTKTFKGKGFIQNYCGVRDCKFRDGGFGNEIWVVIWCFSGLWGWHCKSSSTTKENCALKCLSSVCYEHIYGDDPLEEGELDYKRGKEFQYCMYRLSLGETIDDVKGAFDM